MTAASILVILGHPARHSLCGALAERYAEGARQRGASVQTLALGELAFDPVLRAGYRTPQALEDALAQAQQAILHARHLAFVYPVWWGAMPALLKGFVDRVFLPGFAFRYRDGSARWDRLLAGRAADLLVTMDAPPWYYRWFDRMPGHWQMKRTILQFSGIDPVRVASYGPVRTAAAAHIERLLDDAARRGARAAMRLPAPAAAGA